MAIVAERRPAGRSGFDAPGRAAARRPLGPLATARAIVSGANARALLLYCALAVMVQISYWRDLGSVGVPSEDDQTMFEWFIAYTAWALTNGGDPLSAEMINAPESANVLANTSVIGIGIPLLPITLLFGARVTFVIALTAGLALTAFGWFLLLRKVVRSPAAAALGGLFCGFAPAMVAHSVAHVNWVANFLFPAIVWAFLRLPDHRHWLRNGFALGALGAYQVFIGPELLAVCAIALVVFGIAYAATDVPAAIEASRRALPALAAGATLSIAILAYPIWFQFFGPGGYDGIHPAGTHTDALSFGLFPRASISGGSPRTGELAMNATEENSNFGLPLCLVLVASCWWLRRNRLVRASAVTIGVMCALALGGRLHIGDVGTTIKMPWGLFENLPVVESIITSRLAYGAIPAIALVLALVAREALTVRTRSAAAFAAMAAAALAPLFPIPRVAEMRERPIPEFIADGEYRDWVTLGGTLVSAPLADAANFEPMRWQIATGFEFRIPGGHFLGPRENGNGWWGAVERPTTTLFKDAVAGRAASATDEARREMAADLAFWEAEILLVVDEQRGSKQLVELSTELLGFEGTRVGGVTVWDVRGVR
jgi:hypothetical protein